MKLLPSVTALLSAAVLFGFAPSLRAETRELRVVKQPGLLYLPTVIMEKQGLVEKRAKAAGLTDFKTTWTVLASGGASTDALLADQVDMVVAGSTNLLLIWAKTNGGVKGVTAAGALPMQLLTNNPDIKSLADFKDTDRIAVPTLKVSSQATVLQIAAEKQFGKAGIDRFNTLCVVMGHPDAYIQLQNKSGAINSHFSLPPFQELELKIPGVRSVLKSTDVVGPVSNGVVFATTKFHDENPKVVRAFVDAMSEAVDFIKNDPHAAAELYLSVNKEKLTVDELTELLKQPDMLFSAAPVGTMILAEFMARAGYIKPQPASWKEYFFAEVHGLPGS